MKIILIKPTMMKTLKLLLPLLLILFTSCEKEDSPVTNESLKYLLRIEALLIIDDSDFTQSNGQVSQDLKETHYLHFDTRDGEKMINESTNEVNTLIDYTSFFGTAHTGFINAQISMVGDIRYIDFEAERQEVAGSVKTTYGLKVQGLAETRDEVIDDGTKIREISFDLIGSDVCTFIKDATAMPPRFDTNYHWESPPIIKDLIDCDCSSQSSLTITFFFSES